MGGRIIKYKRLTKFRLGTVSLTLFFRFKTLIKPSKSIDDLIHDYKPSTDHEFSKDLIVR
jgi:hypothetical protein